MASGAGAFLAMHHRQLFSLQVLAKNIPNHLKTIGYEKKKKTLIRKRAFAGSLEGKINKTKKIVSSQSRA